MIFPSTITLILGAVILFALAVLDWYVWGVTPVRRYPLWPRSTRLAENHGASDLRNVA